MTAGQVGAQDLGFGELRAGGEVVLAVEPDRDPGARYDRTARRAGWPRPEKSPRWAVAAPWCAPSTGEIRASAGSTTERIPGTVNDVSATLVASTTRMPECGVEHPVLLGRRQPGVQRQHLGAGQFEGGDRVGGVADLALPGAEHQDVAVAQGVELRHGVALSASTRSSSARPSSAVQARRRGGSAPRRGTCARHLDHGGVVEVLAEPGGVDRRRGDDDLEVGAPRQQLLEVAEQEVDVEAALVGLVDDDRVVAAQIPVALARRAGCRRSSP
jgi:hypothetical protein